MDQRELLCNIEILESLGWFIVEKEGNDGFDVVLQCCRPDWTVYEEVPVTDFLISLYEEEDGSLEERLWFFAPKYATSLDNLENLIKTVGNYEYSIRSELGSEGRYYEAEIVRLDCEDGGEVYEVSTHYGTSNISASMALAEAYLRCVGVYDG